MKMIFLFLSLSSYSFSQDLKFIPDSNLRLALTNYGYTTSDSLDLSKIHGCLVLNLSKSNIENLEGLQYFEKVWHLEINDNNIKRLDYLPPNLTELYCNRNKIERIDNLPRKLINLFCTNNKIDTIVNLPSSLKKFVFGNNLLKTLPILPKNIQLLNYSSNPIDLNSLPKNLQKINCEDALQNCLPFNQLKWNILNANIKDPNLGIMGLDVMIKVTYGNSMGWESETLKYELENDTLVANRIEFKRVCNPEFNSYSRDTSMVIGAKYKIAKYKLNEFLNDLYTNNLNIYINDTVEPIDLTKIKNSEVGCIPMCMDCSHINYFFTIHSKSEKIDINYGLAETIGGLIDCIMMNFGVDIKSVIDWLYFYKLAYLALPNHHHVIKNFNQNLLDKLRYLDE